MSSHPQNNRNIQAKRLRTVRRIHRSTGIILFILLFFVSISGIILGWKKNCDGYILPDTQMGISSDFKDWLSIDSLHSIAINAFKDSLSLNNTPELDKIDVRKNKGIVKFVFEDGYWGVQIDGTTGEILQIQRRWSDLIENIHDGSIIDDLLDTKNDIIKIVFTSLSGLGIMIFVITGFWLWYVPKKIKRNQKILR